MLTNIRELEYNWNKSISKFTNNKQIHNLQCLYFQTTFFSTTNCMYEHSHIKSCTHKFIVILNLFVLLQPGTCNHIGGGWCLWHRWGMEASKQVFPRGRTMRSAVSSEHIFVGMVKMR